LSLPFPSLMHIITFRTFPATASPKSWKVTLRRLKAPYEEYAISRHGTGILSKEVENDQFARWRQSVRLASQASNIWMKLGGIDMPLCGFNFFAGKLPPSSRQIALAWRPYFEICLEAFGVHRCLIGSNFPVDKGSFTYKAFWNACKQLTQALSLHEREAIFTKNAARFYRLEAHA